MRCVDHRVLALMESADRLFASQHQARQKRIVFKLLGQELIHADAAVNHPAALQCDARQDIAGAFGMAYFVYGKRQSKVVPLVAGILLCIYPYFTENPYALLGIGAALLAAPFLLDF